MILLNNLSEYHKLVNILYFEMNSHFEDEDAITFLCNLELHILKYKDIKITELKSMLML
jgi:hypothetical protein